MYLGRAPRTKETLPDFREEMSGHPTFTSFRGLTGSQRTPGIWGVTSFMKYRMQTIKLITLAGRFNIVP